MHDIETQYPKSWVAYERDTEPRGRAVNWLCDKDMLPSIVPQARIWVFNYNSNCYSDGAQEIDTQGQGNSFLEMISAKLDGIATRLIIFIGPCYGGIVVAQVCHWSPRSEKDFPLWRIQMMDFAHWSYV